MPANAMYPWYEDGGPIISVALGKGGIEIETEESYWPGFTDGTGFRALRPASEPQPGEVIELLAGNTVVPHEVVEADFAPPILQYVGVTRDDKGLDVGNCGDFDAVDYTVVGHGDPVGELTFVRTEDLDSGRFHWFPGLQWSDVCGGQDPAYYAGPKEVVLVDLAGNVSDPIFLDIGSGRECGGCRSAELGRTWWEAILSRRR